jgi:hypothetical protein
LLLRLISPLPFQLFKQGKKKTPSRRPASCARCNTTSTRASDAKKHLPQEEEEELQNNNRVVDIQLTDLLDFEEEEDGAAEEEDAAGGDGSHCLLPCRELTADEIRAADQVMMKRSDLDAVLFTKYSIPIRARYPHRAAQPGTWGPRADDTRYYLNDELVNYWFKAMLNTKLDERAFAGTREKNECLLSSYFLSKPQENMRQR